MERFLSYLASRENVAASTQRQALNALVFLYRDVLAKPLGNKIAPVRAGKKTADIKTTEMYTHVMQQDKDSLQSPLDLLEMETGCR
ncbi:MAG: phage integrase N-terminal SAM-like domain-containing protein [Desulfobulbaceae bacterium]|nr:phage integrase N-terminal SAM-like domain-containing protein [Desulfobulbaceae bacterium]